MPWLDIIGAIDCTHTHQSTRAIVERTVLKARWMCLDTTGGKLLHSPEKALTCCVLHNIAMNEGLSLPEPAQADNMSEDPPLKDRLIKVPS